MTRLLPLVLLLLVSSGAHAESYAGREDVQAFVQDLRKNGVI